MVRQAETDDSVLNMTPMIDIVFQLILFFLFSLRFKALDHRIDSAMPKDRGPGKILVFPEPIPTLKVVLSRDRPEDPASPTKMKLGGYEFVLPSTVWTGDGAKDAALEERRDQVFRSLEAKMRALNPDGKLKGEIRLMRPKGEGVPHGDVVKVIDAFFGADMRDLVFEGGRAPVSHRQDH